MSRLWAEAHSLSPAERPALSQMTGIESEEHKMKFKVNEIYTRPGLFGPSWDVRCLARTEHTATFEQVGYEEDGGVEITIELDGETEVCMCWEYMGHNGYIRADR